MDQGAAAIWAAGIGVGGVVVTAGMGWYAARKAAAAQIEAAHRAAAAQVDAVLAGVQAQFSAQRQEAMWQVRREAYIAFLGQVEAVRVAVVDLAHFCSEAIDTMARAGSTGPDLDTPRDQLAQIYKDLWLRDASLRLSVSLEEAERAEQLRLLVSEAVEDVNVLVDMIYAGSQFRTARRRSQTSVDELHHGIVEWTRTAREHLGSASQEP
ncbi:hypothetical protein QQY66_33410 [Streptomyces sp. DG2A-72]|uniref:hypothetical protein n=1 Tax=Streptomyces sp. DG2A-72 TaxID=3051386 RepID=UPI00265C3C0E|nr:hypothetical protein [Streptomyces sp. DG2A-72]MDO0936360.1 hypothetical protein [Streptomyces sp. DG2A-72]